MKTALVIDWGIGGFSLIQQLKKDKVPVEVVYISDSGYTPYGKLKPFQVRARLREIVKKAKLLYPIDFVVIACNAASTAFIGKKEILDLPLINMIEPTAEHLQKMAGAALTVVGGNLTVSSRSYSRLLKRSSHVIDEVSLQPLSALIEKGQAVGPSAKKVLISRLGSEKRSSGDTIVLACTHYPASKKLFRQLYRCRIYDPALAVSQAVRKYSRLSGTLNILQVYTTGSVSEMPLTLRKAFNTRLPADLFCSLAVC